MACYSRMNDILFKSEIRSTVQIEGCPPGNKRNASVSLLVGMLIAALYLSIWIMPNPQAMWMACGLLYFLWLLFLNQGSREFKKYLFYVGSSLLNSTDHHIIIQISLGRRGIHTIYFYSTENIYLRIYARRCHSLCFARCLIDSNTWDVKAILCE